MPKKTVESYHLSLRAYASIFLGALILFAAAATVANRHVMAGWEHAVFYAIYRWPDGLRPLFLPITQLGNGWMLLIVPLVAYVNKQKILARQLIINGFITFFLVEWMKYLIDRPRPVILDASVAQREVFASGSGFPSGHTAMATVLALTILPFVPRKYWWLLAAWIVGVGISRIYLGVHAPLDVVGGACIGIMVACASHLWGTRPGKHAKKAA